MITTLNPRDLVGYSTANRHAKTRHAVFIFTWPGMRGPIVRRFTEPQAFEGYVKEWKALCGLDSVTWLNPYTVQAHA